MEYLKTMNYNFKPQSVRAVLNLWGHDSLGEWKSGIYITVPSSSKITVRKQQ